MRLCSASIYRATIVARLKYAASAWRGFTKASDRQRINSVIDCARRLGYCSPDTPTFDELCDTADDELFSKAVQLSKHVLHALLPPPPHNAITLDTDIIFLSMLLSPLLPSVL